MSATCSRCEAHLASDGVCVYCLLDRVTDRAGKVLEAVQDPASPAGASTEAYVMVADFAAYVAALADRENLKKCFACELPDTDFRITAHAERSDGSEMELRWCEECADAESIGALL